MSRFRFKQPTIELLKFLILDIVPEQCESLTTTGFDQAGNKQTVNCSLWFVLANKLMKPWTIMAR
jgi:hypothetical protein